jgi:hypothetical protein
MMLFHPNSFRRQALTSQFHSQQRRRRAIDFDQALALLAGPETERNRGGSAQRDRGPFLR